MILSYPLAWVPLLTVLAALVLLNAWLVIVALALVAVLALALVLGLAWGAVAEFLALVRRGSRERARPEAAEQERARVGRAGRTGAG